MAARKRGQKAPTVPAVPPRPVRSQEAIARRAYAIYVANGRRDGRAREDWLQAERELQDEVSGTSNGESRPQGPSDPRVKYSELLNGKRPSVDVRLIKAVMGAAVVKESGRVSDPAATPADRTLVPVTRSVCRDSPAARAAARVSR